MHLVLKVISSPWFWGELLLAGIGGVVVFWGLTIEKRAEKLMPPETFKQDIFGDIVAKYKAEMERGWRILMIGVGIEVIAAILLTSLSGLEMAESNETAENARVLAATAMGHAANTESNNLILRSNIAALELKTQPRLITESQVTNFIYLMEKVSKIPITISIGQEGFDTETFAYQLRQMFSQAGFTTNEANDGFGIKTCPARHHAIFTGSSPLNADVVIIVPQNEWASNYIGHVIGVELCGSFLRPVVTNTNAIDVFSAINHVLPQIGIPCEASSGGGWNDVNGYEVFVPVKGQY